MDPVGEISSQKGGTTLSPEDENEPIGQERGASDSIRRETDKGMM